MLKHLLAVVVICASMLLPTSGSAQSTGTLFFSSGATQTQLYKVDNPGTASVAATPIGTPYSTIYNGIGYYNDMLYGIAGSGAVVSINPATGVVTSTGVSLPGGHNYASGDIANGILYTTDIDGAASSHNLYRVNIANATYTSVPCPYQFADFVYYNGYLYGAASAQGGHLVYKIDPANGSAVQVGGSTEISFSAATWSDGTGMIYFDRQGTYNVNTNTITLNTATGTTTAGVAGSGSGFDDATWSSTSSNTPLTNGGTIGSDQTGCGTYDPAMLTSIAPASGGSGPGAIQYRWWMNGSLITGATSATYDPAPVTATTTYQREANRVGTTAWVASNTVTVTITACDSNLTSGGTIGSNQTGCGTYDPATLTSLTPASGGTGTGAIQYRWKENGVLVVGATSDTFNPGPITATTNYLREANRVGTTAWVASNTVTVTITACDSNLTSGGTIGSDQNGCGTYDPAPLTSLTPASGGTGAGAIQYRWKENGTLIVGATADTYDPGPITATTNYLREANRIGTALWVASNTVTVTVDSACGVDFTIDIDQLGSSELFVGGSLPVDIYVQNLTPIAAIASFTLTRPSASSGLTLTIGDSTGWTVTVTTAQYIFTSNNPIAGNGTVSVPATINRIGGSVGDFTLNATITSADDSNPENNNSSITVTKL
jgi:hypothetical protein